MPRERVRGVKNGFFDFWPRTVKNSVFHVFWARFGPDGGFWAQKGENLKIAQVAKMVPAAAGSDRKHIPHVGGT